MTRVAEKTGLERTHLYRKLKQLGVDLTRGKRSGNFDDVGILKSGPNLAAILQGSGPVAQSVEQRIENPCVGGSIPPQATRQLKYCCGRFFTAAASLRNVSCLPIHMVERCQDRNLSGGNKTEPQHHGLAFPRY
jgi:hypothetical protein